MTTRTFPTFPLAAALTLALAGGCVVTTKKTDTDNEVGGGTTTTTYTTSTTSEGGGGSGEGGSIVEGGGGSGGSGEGGSIATGGSGGGEPECVGEAGTGKNDDECGSLPIASAPDTCTEEGGTDGDLAPPGLDVCTLGFQIFTAGSAELLLGCLSDIGVEPANACDPDLPQDCVATMYASACELPHVSDACGAIEQTCEGAGQAFDEDQCRADLKPFSQTGVAGMVDCINDNADIDCQDAYELCLNDAFTL